MYNTTMPTTMPRLHAPNGTESRATYDMQYGTLYVGPYRDDANGHWRDDVYHPADGRPSVVEPAMCAGPGDISKRYDPLNAYDSRCSCCYLHVLHTVEKHFELAPRVAP